ncbi:MAG: hypothetical protein V4665_00875 [Patescibacteria group bacterium]
MKRKIIILSFLIAAWAPFAVFAIDGVPTQQETAQQAVDVCKSVGAPFKTLGQIFNWATCFLIKSIVPLLFALATVGFIWGMIQYFLNPDNEEKRKQGKSFMIWGIVALFVMISMWGVVGVLSNTFGVKTLVPQLSQ